MAKQIEVSGVLWAAAALAVLVGCGEQEAQGNSGQASAALSGVTQESPRASVAADANLARLAPAPLADPCDDFAIGQAGQAPGEASPLPPPRTNDYLPLSCRRFSVQVPVDLGTLEAMQPANCYSGSVSFTWEGMRTVGALSHGHRLDASNQLGCNDADLAAVFAEAAGNGGRAQAELTLKTVESLQFDNEGGCVRGFYELVELRFAASPSRIFNTYAFNPVQEVPEATCDGLIALARP